MLINAPLQPNMTGELINFGFHKTSVTFGSLNPVLTVLDCVNNNDMGENHNTITAPRHSLPEKEAFGHQGRSGGKTGEETLTYMKMNQEVLIMEAWRALLCSNKQRKDNKVVQKI